MELLAFQSVFDILRKKEKRLVCIIYTQQKAFGREQKKKMKYSLEYAKVWLGLLHKLFSQYWTSHKQEFSSLLLFLSLLAVTFGATVNV